LFIFNYSTYKIINIKRRGYEKFQKIRRIRILGTRIFCKSFGGKILDFQTDVNYLELFLKKWRMRILSARYFSKSFGGKIREI